MTDLRLSQRLRVADVAGGGVGPLYHARCHCGAVVLVLHLPDGIVDPYRCNCSLCRRRGAIMAEVAPNGLTLVEGAASLRRYQFGSFTAEHFFCGHCGIYTHHRQRADPNRYSYNVGCLDGIDPYALALPIAIEDGAYHPSDR